ncbi:MAG: hypothetical protein HY422_01750, partial [Candidatus Komeilibacteria bacterium]|nr:hypothetical protein [Candidatus Komeilibacteria bacterium]
ALDANVPIVVYSAPIDVSYYELRVVKCTGTDCSAVAPGTPKQLTTSGIAYFPTLVLDSQKKPTISYETTNYEYLITCSDLTCQAFSQKEIDHTIGVGLVLRSAMTVDKNGYPIISFGYQSGNLKVVHCNDEHCQSYSKTDVSTDQINLGLGVAIGDDGFPVIAYRKEADQSLRYIKCGTLTCSPQSLKGLGWVAFSPKRVGDITYVEGQGNIFSGGNIYSPVGPPVNKYNSAYIIEASGDITNWFSQNLYKFGQRGIASPYLKEGSGQSQVYQSALGKLDYKGIVTDVVTGKEVSPTNQNGTNKYGGVLTYRSPSDAGLPDSDALAKRVFFWKNPGSLININAQTINCQAGTNGAGIIVIDGDLTINGDVTYGSSCNSGLSKLSEIASLVWIVRGDVTIDPSVEYLAGTFIVLGDGNPAKCPALSSLSSNGCGRFSTGTSDAQLTSYGAVLARQFSMERTYPAETGPSELFISDGRLQANTPAGLSDLAKSLPRFSGGFQ